jgi:hypothetical protein
LGDYSSFFPAWWLDAGDAFRGGAHAVLNAVGVFEPTPFSDLANAGLYALEGLYGVDGSCAHAVVSLVGAATSPYRTPKKVP